MRIARGLQIWILALAGERAFARACQYIKRLIRVLMSLRGQTPILYREELSAEDCFIGFMTIYRHYFPPAHLGYEDKYGDPRSKLNQAVLYISAKN